MPGVENKRAFMRILFIIACFMLAAPSTLAQEAADPGNAKQRLALSRQMHEIRPIKMQVEEVITQMALRYPENRRDEFISRMMEIFDNQTLTEISVHAMADTFTVPELEKMIEFHGSPEGKAVSKKMPVYQALVEPELIKKIDQALMELRTGKPGDQP